MINARNLATFLYRENYYNPDADLPYELESMGANSEFSFAKYREGSLETKGLFWDANKVKYVDPDERQSEHFLPEGVRYEEINEDHFI